MKTYKLLFLCTHNSARSILGEALASTDASGRFIGYSAGSTPGGKVNPFAAELAIKMGYPADKLRSKSWDEFAAPDAPRIDIAITVCGNAAGEACPLFIGAPARAHWGLADPAEADGADVAVDAAFAETYHLLEMRVAAMLALPLETMSEADLRDALNTIGRMEGAA